MKKFLTFSLALTLSVLSAAQENTREYYQLKAKKQKTLGWILLGGGIGTSLIGMSQLNFAGSRDGHVNNTPGAVLFFTGLVATITSFPVFASAKRNQKRALSVSLKGQTHPFPQRIAAIHYKIPALQVTIHL